MNPTLADLLRDPSRVGDIPPAMIPPVLYQLSALQGALAARLISAAHLHDGQKETRPSDRLLTPAETAAKLGLSKDWLYRNARKLPFTVRVSWRNVRFSEQGIERYIRHVVFLNHSPSSG